MHFVLDPAWILQQEPSADPTAVGTQCNVNTSPAPKVLLVPDIIVLVLTEFLCLSALQDSG